MEDLSPGFRFYPTEEELVSFYLHNKLLGRRPDLDRVIPVLYIYEFNPWDLPQFAGEWCRRDPEQWFFFIPRQEKEARGGRPNRLTTSGYWKATGSPSCVYSSRNHRVIGMKRTMVFYQGRAPNGRKTEWKMNEYRAVQGDLEPSPSTTIDPELTQGLSLCRVYKKTKCARAFDRRPSAAAAATVTDIEAMMLQRHTDQHQHGDLHVATVSHHNHPTAERTSSPESSSSGDHTANITCQTLPHDDQHDNNMAIDYEPPDPIWDWEQLNCFFREGL